MRVVYQRRHSKPFIIAKEENMTLSGSPQVSNRTVFILLSLIGLILYLNSFTVPFHFDDIYYLKENLITKSFQNFWTWLTRDFSALLRGRAFLLFTFFLNYKIGGLDTFNYHLLNLFIHIFNAFLLYAIASRYIEGDNERGFSLKSLIAAVLFLVHPVNTESVTYISSRSSELSAFFVLLSLSFFLRATEHRFHAGYYMASLIAFLLGLSTKEAAIVLPALLVLFDYFFISKSAKRLVLRLRFYVPYLVVLLATSFVYISYATMPLLNGARPLLTHVLTEVKVFTQYLRLLTIPVGLNIDHDVKPSEFIDVSVMASLAIIVFLLAAAALLRKKHNVLSFSILWFFINMAPFFVIRLNDFMAERWLYTASIGFCIGLTDALVMLTIRYQRTGIALTGAVLLMSGTLTVLRNHVYTNPILLWEDASHKSPEKYRPFVNLSCAYMENGNSAKAIESAQEAIKLWKKAGLTNNDIVSAYINLSSAYGSDDPKAEEVLKAVEGYAANNPEYYGVLGSLYMKRGQYENALSSFNKALSYYPQSASFLFIIGKCYENIGQKKKAREYYVDATMVIPQNAQEFMAQGESFSSLGNYEKASDCFFNAVLADPLDVSNRVYFAEILRTNGYFDKAFQQYAMASRISPCYAPAYKGMGIVMLAKGQPAEARKYFNKALTLLPPDAPDRRDLTELLEKTRG